MASTGIVIAVAAAATISYTAESDGLFIEKINDDISAYFQYPVDNEDRDTDELFFIEDGESDTEQEDILEENIPPVVEEPIVEEPEFYYEPNHDDVVILAKLMYREARGAVDRDPEQVAKVGWTVLNRLDHGGYGSTIYEVVTMKYQFAYHYDTPVWQSLYDIAYNVLYNYHKEKAGFEANRLLPSDYLWFSGDGTNNHFRNRP